MKTLLVNSKAICIVLFSLISFQSIAHKSAGGDPSQLTFNIVLPDSWQSTVVRQDYGNETVFNFKTDDGKQIFLFSVTKVTGDQWLSIKDQVQHATILKNENGYIIFLQQTDQLKIKGSDNAQYQTVLTEMNNVINSIQVNS